MLVAEEAAEIRVLSRQGKSIREIARALRVSRNTVRRYDNMRTVVTDRDLYGPGLHRYNPIDPGPTKGKVERFIGYLRSSFYVPLASQLSPEGLKVDRETANTRVGTWLREVANARVHATTGEIPLVRLEQERERLQSIPAPWPGTLQPAAPKRPGLPGDQNARPVRLRLRHRRGAQAAHGTGESRLRKHLTVGMSRSKLPSRILSRSGQFRTTISASS
jgi:hypothetical protein